MNVNALLDNVLFKSMFENNVKLYFSKKKNAKVQRNKHAIFSEFKLSQNILMEKSFKINFFVTFTKDMK